MATSTDSTDRFCKNCKFFDFWVGELGRSIECDHPEVVQPRRLINPVTGPFIKKADRVDCEFARSDKGACGPEGKLYEQRPVKPSLWKRMFG